MNSILTTLLATFQKIKLVLPLHMILKALPDTEQMNGVILDFSKLLIWFVSTCLDLQMWTKNEYGF